jgi:two-component system response regulator
MILLVEDNSDDAFFFERAMKKANLFVPVYNAKNGQEAVDYLHGEGKYDDRAAHPIPSVIFLDLRIPRLHGFDVLRWVKQQLALERIPVFITSSSPLDADHETARQLGAEGFFIKPLTPPNLLHIFQFVRKFSVAT